MRYSLVVALVLALASPAQAANAIRDVHWTCHGTPLATPDTDIIMHATNSTSVLVSFRCDATPADAAAGALRFSIKENDDGTTNDNLFTCSLPCPGIVAGKTYFVVISVCFQCLSTASNLLYPEVGRSWVVRECGGAGRWNGQAQGVTPTADWSDENGHEFLLEDEAGAEAGHTPTDLFNCEPAAPGCDDLFTTPCWAGQLKPTVAGDLCPTPVPALARRQIILLTLVLLVFGVTALAVRQRLVS
ncbi:MAG: hypothetical protein HYZ09_02655 [Candidatus Kerfeldbacteria bacterium]|nr:hypothetical protein [Candidatus Kerfeldbacteria bacterium]